ncbi:hypothetical protein [Paracoccus mutanolyticus]|nr:hypothetical protein [Paracoccus mutanolyticus]
MNELADLAPSFSPTSFPVNPGPFDAAQIHDHLDPSIVPASC